MAAETNLKVHVETTAAKLPEGVLGVDAVTPDNTRQGVRCTCITTGRPINSAACARGWRVLDPGASPHPPHQHPEEEFLIIASGTGEIECAGRTTQVGPGAIMYCAGNTIHGIVNTGKVPMTFYWSKWLSRRVSGCGPENPLLAYHLEHVAVDWFAEEEALDRSRTKGIHRLDALVRQPAFEPASCDFEYDTATWRPNSPSNGEISKPLNEKTCMSWPGASSSHTTSTGRVGSEPAGDDRAASARRKSRLLRRRSGQRQVRKRHEKFLPDSVELLDPHVPHRHLGRRLDLDAEEPGLVVGRGRIVVDHHRHQLAVHDVEERAAAGDDRCTGSSRSCLTSLPSAVRSPIVPISFLLFAPKPSTTWPRHARMRIGVFSE